jgi:hypothetical protein
MFDKSRGWVIRNGLGRYLVGWEFIGQTSSLVEIDNWSPLLFQ